MGPIHIDATVKLAALQEHPAYARFKAKYADVRLEPLHTDFLHKVETLLSAEEASPAFKRFNDLRSEAEQAYKAMKDAEGGVDYAEMKAEFAAVQEELNLFFRGEKYAGVSAPKEIVQAFAKFEAAVETAHGTLDGWFSKVRFDGFQKAAEQSLEEMQVWKEGAKKTRNIGFAKSAVAAGGALALVHSVLPDQSKEGDGRSALLRGGEALLGAGTLAGALLAGKIR